MTMPKINLDLIEKQLTPARFELVKGIVSTRGKNKGCLRASKPKVAKMTKFDAPDEVFGYRYDYATDEERKQAMTAYVWRMVAFAISPQRQHACMPVMCECELPGTGSERRKLAKMLDDEVVEVVVRTVPLTQQTGTLRWGRALGYF